ncbi:hypothetical protein [Flavivirga sp. 57AJ16]|uniref:hypothetical protein n=1 Tax=Flavivirga sp. 57AJ16 TaxID=3025307 RepID=UPI00236621DE|nr:hypothetical protein [Flavivirga sp. 57AJ16]MDD7885635.1 hypothetical protein [Flavivirga sp. 57AJ16]
MKSLTITIFFLGLCLLTNAQDKPEIGDELVINPPNGVSYNHIDFPKLNFLVKRGKLANYKNVYGTKVIIKDIEDKGDGHIYVILKKKHGGKFFGFLNEVEANYNKSIESEELSVVMSSEQKSAQ